MSYKDNGDGTVTDTETGLMWQQQDDGKGRTWEEAMAYANGLRLGGHADWRLPKIDELKTLVDLNRKPTIDPVFTDTESSYYWSSTTGASYTSVAWIVYFYDGGASYGSKAYSYYVRCVR